MKKLLSITVVTIVAVALSGCEDMTGGGTMASASDPQKKATFGFSLHCEDKGGTPVLRGEIEYRDPGAKFADAKGKLRSLKVHGEAVESSFPNLTTCEELCESIVISPPFSTLYTGIYTPLPPSMPGGEGVFFIFVEDLGQKGPSTGDGFGISFLGGAFDEYVQAAAELEKGQITLHMP